MKVEIWSDIVCPFCYIGKRKFEIALEQFAGKEKVEIEWHSYQLDPNARREGENAYQSLAEKKGQSLEWSIKMHENVTQMAKSVGLEYNFDKAQVCNSFDAHRLIQFAKTKGKGDEAEERIFRAYFTEGKLISDHTTLRELATEIGLKNTDIDEVLKSDTFATEVERDCEEAYQIGVTGVPFFVFDRKYAVSGAQNPETFLEVLNKVAGQY